MAHQQSKLPPNLARYKNHDCCPKDWRGIHDMTGSYELDALIDRVPRPAVLQKLEDHLVTDVAYQKRTAYNGSTLD